MAQRPVPHLGSLLAQRGLFWLFCWLQQLILLVQAVIEPVLVVDKSPPLIVLRASLWLFVLARDIVESSDKLLDLLHLHLGVKQLLVEPEDVVLTVDSLNNTLE